jgi:hypothetical protein
MKKYLHNGDFKYSLGYDESHLFRVNFYDYRINKVRSECYTNDYIGDFDDEQKSLYGVSKKYFKYNNTDHYNTW